MSWRTARSITQLQRELDAAHPSRTKPDWIIGDTAHRNRPSDHNPNPQGVVCAIDVRGRNVATPLFDHLLRSRDPRIKYVIYDRNGDGRDQIFSSTNQPWQVRQHTSRAHTSHLHVSVGRGPDGRSTHPNLYDDPGPWGLTQSDPSTPSHEEDDVLKRGDRGAEVRYAQEQVNRMLTGRHDSGPLEIDGIFGEQTERQVKEAQKQLGWDQTGQVTALFADRMLHRVLARDMAFLDVETKIVKRPVEAFR